MLKNDRQNHHRLARLAVQEQTAGTDPILRFAIQHRFYRVIAGLRFQESNIQPGITVIAFFLSRVIAGKLESMAPFELERNGIQCQGGQRPSS